MKNWSMNYAIIFFSLLLFPNIGLSQNWSVNGEIGIEAKQFLSGDASNADVTTSRFGNLGYDLNGDVQYLKGLFIARFGLGVQFWDVNYSVKRSRRTNSKYSYGGWSRKVNYQSNLFLLTSDVSLGVNLFPKLEKYDFRVLAGVNFQKQLFNGVLIDESMDRAYSYSSYPPDFNGNFSEKLSYGKASELIEKRDNNYGGSIRIEFMYNHTNALRVGCGVGFEKDLFNWFEYEDVTKRYGLSLGVRIERTLSFN